MGRAEIILEGVDKRAMFLVLCIMHENFRMLPRRLNHKKFADLAYFARKYDLNRTLRGFIESWAEDGPDLTVETDAEDWLFILNVPIHHSGMHLLIAHHPDYMFAVRELALSQFCQSARDVIQLTIDTPICKNMPAASEVERPGYIGYAL
jgi:hypothetical protein